MPASEFGFSQQVVGCTVQLPCSHLNCPLLIPVFVIVSYMPFYDILMSFEDRGCVPLSSTVGYDQPQEASGLLSWCPAVQIIEIRLLGLCFRVEGGVTIGMFRWSRLILH